MTTVDQFTGKDFIRAVETVRTKAAAITLGLSFQEQKGIEKYVLSGDEEFESAYAVLQNMVKYLAMMDHMISCLSLELGHGLPNLDNSEEQEAVRDAIRSL